MNITDEIINYVAKLSKLELSQEEKEKQKNDMQSIVNYVEIMNLLDTKEIEATSHIYPIKNVFREDRAESSYDREDILLNAPNKKDGYYKVPKTVD